MWKRLDSWHSRVGINLKYSLEGLLLKLKYSLEGLLLKLKLQYFGHLMWRADSLEKTLMLGKIEGRRRRGTGWDGWMTSPTRWTWVWVNSGSWWWTGKPGMLQSMGLQRGGRDWATELNWLRLGLFYLPFHLGPCYFQKSFPLSPKDTERGNVLGLDSWYSRLIPVQTIGISSHGDHSHGLSSRTVSSVIYSRHSDKQTVIMVTICLLKVTEVLTIFKTLWRVQDGEHM